MLLFPLYSLHLSSCTLNLHYIYIISNNSLTPAIAYSNDNNTFNYIVHIVISLMLLYLFDKHQLLIPSEMHYNYLHMNYYQS